MHRTRQRGAFEGFALRVILREGDADFGRQFSDATDGRRDHFLFHADRGAAEIDPVTLRVNAHDREHARAERSGAKIGRGERLTFAVIVHGRVGEQRVFRRAVRGLRAQPAEIFDVDLDAHLSVFAPRAGAVERGLLRQAQILPAIERPDAAHVFDCQQFTSSMDCRPKMHRPTLFDIQVNGFAGGDFQRADLALDALRHAVDRLRAHETHRIFLTLISAEPEQLCAQFERVERFRNEDALIAETICGYHLEGPFLSPLEGYRGAHRGELQRAPDLALFEKMQRAAGGRIRLVTLAPECPGSAEFIAEVVRSGVAVSLGHTDASDAQIDAAIEAGASLCTHLGNGVPQMLPRHDNIIQRLLARDELTACLIPDGAHLPPSVLRNLFRAKPHGKVIFTTDAMSAAAAPPGRYTLGDTDVESRDGAVRAPGSAYLAGSCLTPDRGVANAAEWLRISIEEARAMFSIRAAQIFRIELPMIE